MTNIAICDNNNYFCSNLENIIKQYENYDINIKIFNKSKDLCNYLINTCDIDLIFLDIEFEKDDYSGIEVGEFIRNKIKNQIVELIYISAYSYYSMQLFDYRPMNFLLKPIDKNKIFKLLNTYQQRSNSALKNKYFKFKVKNEIYQIEVNSIMYFYSNKHQLGIVTFNKEYNIYSSLKIIENNQIFKNFIKIHKSFFINPYYILSISYSEIKMQNNQILSISRANRKIVREKLMKTTFKNFY